MQKGNMITNPKQNTAYDLESFRAKVTLYAESFTGLKIGSKIFVFCHTSKVQCEVEAIYASEDYATQSETLEPGQSAVCKIKALESLFLEVI